MAPRATTPAGSSPPPSPVPSEAQVTASLGRILSSASFRGAERSREFLRYVVGKALAGRDDQLKAHAIGVQLLRRPENFDPSTDPIVRVQAGRVRRALEHFYLTEGQSEAVRIDLPAGAYSPTFTYARHRLWQTGPVPAAHTIPSSEPIVGLIPLHDLSGRRSPASFAAALSQELLVAITRFEGFRVLPWPGKGRGSVPGWLLDKGLSQRGVRFVVAGNVYRSADTDRITVLLHGATSGEVIWSETFVRDTSRQGPIEDPHELATRIACRLADTHGSLARAMMRETQDIPIRDLPYREALVRYENTLVRSRPEYVELRYALERAVETNPDQWLTHAMLAMAYIHDYNYLLETLDDPLDRALSFAGRAVALNPGSQRAELSLTYAYACRRQLSEFRFHAQRCLEINPDSSATMGLVGQWMALQDGDWERGLALIARAMELNPDHMPFLHHAPCLHHISRGEYDQALMHARRFNTPGFFWGPLLRASVLGHLGRLNEAREALSETLAVRPDFATRGRVLAGRFVPEGALLDRFMAGLAQAGFREV